MNKEIWGGVGVALIVVILVLGYEGSETLKALTAAATAAKETAQSTKGATAAITATLTQATTTLQSAQTTIDKVQPVLAGLKTTTDRLNAPCAPVKGVVYTVDDEKPCGTIADANQTLRTARGTLGTIERAGRHYDKQLATLDSQEATLFNDLHTTIGAITPVIQQYGDVATNINGWLKGKQLKDLAANFVSTSGNLARFTKDGSDWVHDKTHPTKKKITFWTATEAGGDYVRHFMPPIF